MLLLTKAICVAVRWGRKLLLTITVQKYECSRKKRPNR
jgi:hypothetical protein